MKRALCIWLPEWPIQRIVVARPELSRDSAQPIALHARDPRRGQRIVARCDIARELGMVHDMPLAEATALAGRSLRDVGRAEGAASPKSVGRPFSGSSGALSRSERRLKRPLFMEHEPEADDEALALLAVRCEQFSPIVGLEQGDSPSSLFLDITGLAPIFAGEPRLLHLVQTTFSESGYHVRLGVGDTVGAAWGRAHFGNTSEQDLLELPVAALRLEADTLDILHQLGIETISQLLQLPRKEVARRLGETLIQRIDQLLGKQAEVIIAHRAAPEFEAEWQLEHPTSRRDAIEKILEHLSQQLSGILVKHDHAVVQAEAVLHGQGGVTRRLQISLFEPTSNPRHLSDLLKLQSETVQLHTAIHCVQLLATATVRIHGGQQLLWDDLDAYTGRAQQREVGALIDRLSSRLGKGSVFGVSAQAGALPEKAYRQKCLSSSLRQRKTQTAATLKAPHRPLWLYDPPQVLQVESTSRDARNQPPRNFHFERQQHSVAHYWGPERIETGWWQGKTVRRDYYRVETTSGCRYWLFRRVDNGAWYLHGCFE